MTVPNRKNLPTIHKTEQGVLNASFDEDFQVLAVELLVYNPLTGTMDRMVQSGQTLPTMGTNPSLTLTYTDGNLTKVTKVINGVSYEKTLTWTSGSLTAVSAWSEA